MSPRRVRCAALLMTAGLGMVACENPAGLQEGAEVELTFQGLRPLSPQDGTLAVWVVSQMGDTVAAGTIVSFAGDGNTVYPFTLPVASPTDILVTVEPPGDQDPGPSPYVMLAGTVRGRGAELTILGVVTDGRILETDPGSHSLFTTSNNAWLYYPSFEDAGLWLFTLTPKRNKHGSREVKVTPVRRTWTYAGWAVHRWGTPSEIWVPYGKFRPDELGLLSSRDDTGSGPFSGDEDYLNAGVEDVPGEEWADARVADELGLELPGGLQTPLNLDSVDAVTGEALWHHVITIEPAFDEGEPMYAARPFIIRPYRNPIGLGGPGDPRLIELVEAPPFAQLRSRR